jgi:hypothetical protein
MLCVAAAALIGMLACDSTEPDDITMADVTRSFAAATFETVEGGVTTDHLARGASLTITLNPDGTTSGRMFVPGGAEDGGNLDLSLAGTFLFDDATDEITFDHAADTFLRDVTFRAARDDGQVTLWVEAGFSGPTIVRVLLR